MPRISVRIPQEDWDFILSVRTGYDGVVDMTMTDFLLRVINWLKPHGKDHLRKALGVNDI